MDFIINLSDKREPNESPESTFRMENVQMESIEASIWPELRPFGCK